MLKVLGLIVIGTILLYVSLFYLLRRIFRQFEKDIALVTLNLSAYTVLIIFIASGLKMELSYIQSSFNLAWLNSFFNAVIISAIAYWIWQLSCYAFKLGFSCSPFPNP